MVEATSHGPCQACLDRPGGCGGECGHPVAERNRYFDGKLMVARDFDQEQHYFLGRHMAHNRYLHGWGIVCGLETECHKDPRCRPRWIVVKQGMAIDCCGRQLYLAADTAVDLQAHVPRGTDGSEKEEDVSGRGWPEKWERFLCVEYCESEVELVPALYSKSACDPLRREAGRIREGVRLVLKNRDEVPDHCWPRPHDPDGKDDERKPLDQQTDPHHSRDDPDLPPAQRCVEHRPHGRTPDCPDDLCDCGDCVILARLEWDPEQGLLIDTQYRRIIPTQPQALAHIVHLNWEHGGEMSLKDLEDRGGRLEVTFDRPIREAEGDRTGINQRTFFVQYVQAQRNLEVLPYDRDVHEEYQRWQRGGDPGQAQQGGQQSCDPPLPAVGLIDGRCKAIYTIDRRLLRGLGRSTIWINVYCDFVMDDQNNPVDGEFLRGVPPTGDGVPGGTFVSWFDVVP